MIRKENYVFWGEVTNRWDFVFHPFGNFSETQRAGFLQRQKLCAFLQFGLIHLSLTTSLLLRGRFFCAKNITAKIPKKFMAVINV
jgi:hypothetical protein